MTVNFTNIRLRHVEVRARRVAPAAVVAGEAVVGRAEVVFLIKYHFNVGI
jgi:hypothetical protein